MVQAVLWEVVDGTLRDMREQFASDLGLYWDARRIHQAQLEALQVLLKPYLTLVCTSQQELLSRCNHCCDLDVTLCRVKAKQLCRYSTAVCSGHQASSMGHCRQEHVFPGWSCWACSHVHLACCDVQQFISLLCLANPVLIPEAWYPVLDKAHLL